MMAESELKGDTMLTWRRMFTERTNARNLTSKNRFLSIGFLGEGFINLEMVKQTILTWTTIIGQVEMTSWPGAGEVH